MIIGINASFLRKIDSGTGQVTVNFLRQLILDEKKKKKKDRNRFILYLEEDFSLSEIGLDKEEEQSFFQKRIFLPFYKRDDLVRKIWWEKWLLPKEVERDECQFFFSLYQSTTVFKNKKIKHLMLVHDVIWKIFPQYLNNLRKKIYYSLVELAIFKADKILTISQSSKKDLQKFFGFKEEKIDVALIDCDQVFKEKKELSVELEKILEKYGIEKRGYIFYVGGFDVRKNVSFLLEAYGLLWKNWKSQNLDEKNNFPELVLAGKFNANLVPLVEDLLKKIDEIVKKYALSKEKIKMVGFVEQKNLPVFYFQAGLFVFPSLYEGFGLTPLEAFNCGCPALVNANSSLVEVTGDNPEVSFVMNDPEKLAEKMKEILTSEKQREVLIAIGKSRTGNFSWKKFNSKVEKVFSEF